MAMTVKECDKMIEAAKKAQVYLMVAHNKRFDPFTIAIKKMIDESYIGKIAIGEGHYMGSEHYIQEFLPSDWRLKQASSGGGSFMDLGSHYIDTLLYLISGKVKTVSANTFLLTEGDIMDSEDNCVALLQFDTGTIATVEASWSVDIPPRFEEGLRLWGSCGYVSLNFLGWEGEPEKAKKFQPIELYSKKGIPPWFETLPDKFDALISFERELDHFAESIIEDKKPSISGEEGRRTIQVIEAAYESAKKSKIIKISD
jgi:predicted dehydrogenase